MKKIWKNYRSTIILITSIIIGTIIGLIFGEKTKFLSPFGDLFINLMFVVIVPLIFLTITTSIAKIKNKKRLGKIMISIIAIFVLTSIVAFVIGFLATFKTNLVNTRDTDAIKEVFLKEEIQGEELNLLERTVDTISVDDFQKLLSKEHILALIIISILVGIAIRDSKEKGEKFYEFLVSANEVVLKLINIIMYYAPIGLGCYFASLVGTLGASIAVGYLKTFIIYTVIAILYYFIVYSFYAYISGGKKGFIKYWKNIIPATITSLATCSSAASIPVNTQCAKEIGVSSDIADTMIPLGTSFHKDGSIIGSVFKIMFLVCLFNTDISSFSSILKIFGVAALANLLVMAVPVGGGTISEMMIISLMGYPTLCLPVLTIIATIIDAPATMLNVVGDTASSMLVERVVDGKDWMNKKISKSKKTMLKT